LLSTSPLAAGRLRRRVDLARRRVTGYRGRVSARRRAGLITLATMAGLAVLVPALTGASPASAKCPASAGASAGPVQWVFSELGAPTPVSATVNWSWTHGSGGWASGGASGLICSQDKGGGLATRNLVLKVSGSSTLSPRITKLGLLGVGIVLPVTVSATDDPSCPRGTKGSVTLFASYFAVHRDSVVTHFASPCASHDHHFISSTVHVLIARNGHQVNAAGA
jgi:hypothetical protein